MGLTDKSGKPSLGTGLRSGISGQKQEKVEWPPTWAFTRRGFGCGHHHSSRPPPPTRRQGDAPAPSFFMRPSQGSWCELRFPGRESFMPGDTASKQERRRHGVQRGITFDDSDASQGRCKRGVLSSATVSRGGSGGATGKRLGSWGSPTGGTSEPRHLRETWSQLPGFASRHRRFPNKSTVIDLKLATSPRTF